MTPLIILVVGSPAPKGSSRAMLRGGKPVNVPSGSNVNRDKQDSWKTAVMNAASAVVGPVEAPPFIGVALKMTVVFKLRRPHGHYNPKTGQLKKSAPTWPITKPDKDKLMRTTKDALKGIAYDDDSRVCESLERKRYAKPGEEGAWIKIEVLEDPT